MDIEKKVEFYEADILSIRPRMKTPALCSGCLVGVKRLGQSIMSMDFVDRFVSKWTNYDEEQLVEYLRRARG